MVVSRGILERRAPLGRTLQSSRLVFGVMLEALKTRAGGRWVTAIPVRRIVQAIAGQQLRDVSQQHQDGLPTGSPKLISY